jgi:hypothetical protein
LTPGPHHDPFILEGDFKSLNATHTKQGIPERVVEQNLRKKVADWMMENDSKNTEACNGHLA